MAGSKKSFVYDLEKSEEWNRMAEERWNRAGDNAVKRPKISQKDADALAREVREAETKGPIKTGQVEVKPKDAKKSAAREEKVIKAEANRAGAAEPKPAGTRKVSVRDTPEVKAPIQTQPVSKKATVITPKEARVASNVKNQSVTGESKTPEQSTKTRLNNQANHLTKTTGIPAGVSPETWKGYSQAEKIQLRSQLKSAAASGKPPVYTLNQTASLPKAPAAKSVDQLPQDKTRIGGRAPFDGAVPKASVAEAPKVETPKVETTKAKPVPIPEDHPTRTAARKALEAQRAKVEAKATAGNRGQGSGPKTTPVGETPMEAIQREAAQSRAQKVSAAATPEVKPKVKPKGILSKAKDLAMKIPGAETATKVLSPLAKIAGAAEIGNAVVPGGSLLDFPYEWRKAGVGLYPGTDPRTQKQVMPLPPQGQPSPLIPQVDPNAPFPKQVPYGTPIPQSPEEQAMDDKDERNRFIQQFTDKAIDAANPRTPVVSPPLLKADTQQRRWNNLPNSPAGDLAREASPYFTGEKPMSEGVGRALEGIKGYFSEGEEEPEFSSPEERIVAQPEKSQEVVAKAVAQGSEKGTLPVQEQAAMVAEADNPGATQKELEVATKQEQAMLQDMSHAERGQYVSYALIAAGLLASAFDKSGNASRNFDRNMNAGLDRGLAQQQMAYKQQQDQAAMQFDMQKEIAKYIDSEKDRASRKSIADSREEGANSRNAASIQGRLKAATISAQGANSINGGSIGMEDALAIVELEAPTATPQQKQSMALYVMGQVKNGDWDSSSATDQYETISTPSMIPFFDDNISYQPRGL